MQFQFNQVESKTWSNGCLGARSQEARDRRQGELQTHLLMPRQRDDKKGVLSSSCWDFGSLCFQLKVCPNQTLCFSTCNCHFKCLIPPSCGSALCLAALSDPGFPFCSAAPTPVAPHIQSKLSLPLLSVQALQEIPTEAPLQA